MAISPDFITLCQSQISLLTQTLGAVSVVIYMAKHWGSGQAAELVPILIYPDKGSQAVTYPQVSLPSTVIEPDETSPTVSRQNTPLNYWQRPGAMIPPVQVFSDDLSDTLLKRSKSSSSDDLGKLVLPLMHDGAVLGFLVTTRFDRPWSEQERSQVQQIAQTLAIACFMDQQNRWLQRNLQQKQLVQDRQSQGFHDLLHQFRNPLTALRTFGKLLLKRLQSEEDALNESGNQKIAAGIVRESDHLQALLKQFDQALAVGDRYWQENASTIPPLQLGTAEREQSGVIVPINGVRTLEAATEDYDVFEESGGGDESNAQLHPPGYLTPALLMPTVLGTELKLSDCNLGEILLPLLDSTQAMAQLRNIAMYVDVPNRLPQVYVDPQALEEVLNNLLDNALKYSPDEAWLYIRAGFPELQTRVEAYGILIADGGLGIPAQDLDHIFERHFRGVQEHGEIYGTGLGLSIAKDLVNRMSGEIQVFSPVTTCPQIPADRLHQLTKAHQLQKTGTAFVIWLPSYSPGQIA